MKKKSKKESNKIIADDDSLPNRKVCQYDKKGRYLQTYQSNKQAAMLLYPENQKIAATNIHNCCCRRNKSAYGYIWRFERDCHAVKKLPAEKNTRIVQCDIKMQYIQTYKSAADVVAQMNWTQNTDLRSMMKKEIIRCCKHYIKTAFNYIWMFEPEYNQKFQATEGKAIRQYDMKGHYLRTYPSITDAAKNVDKYYWGNTISTISRCCHGKRYSAVGYIWRLAADHPAGEDLQIQQKATSFEKQPVNQYDISGVYLQTFETVLAAALQIDKNNTFRAATNIYNCCQNHTKTACHYIWAFVSEDRPVGINLPEETVPEKGTRKINQYDLNGNYIRTFPSISAAAKHLKGKLYRNIIPSLVRSCQIKDATACNYFWRYFDEEPDCRTLLHVHIPDGSSTSCKKVNQYDIRGHYLRTFESIAEATESIKGRTLSTKSGCISQCCSHKTRTAYQFIWRYLEEEPECKDLTVIGKKSSRKINQYDLQGHYLQTFQSIAEAIASLQDTIPSNKRHYIFQCCTHKSKTAYGFLWRYFNDEPECNDLTAIDKPPHPGIAPKKVNQYDRQGHYIQTFNSVAEAAASLKNTNMAAKRGNIRQCCAGNTKTAYGFIWRYFEKEPDCNDLINIPLPQSGPGFSKKINQYDKQGHYLQTFDSLAKTAESLRSSNLSSSYSSIRQCCLHKIKTAYGFIWYYFEEKPDCQDL